MYFDAFTVSALVDEFMDTVVGGRIQDVIDVDQTGIGLEVYASRQRQYIYASADQQIPRVHRTEERLRRGRVQPTQLGLLLRRYIEGGIVTHVSQPPFERTCTSKATTASLNSSLSRWNDAATSFLCRAASSWTACGVSVHRIIATA